MEHKRVVVTAEMLRVIRFWVKAWWKMIAESLQPTTATGYLYAMLAAQEHWVGVLMKSIGITFPDVKLAQEAMMKEKVVGGS